MVSPFSFNDFITSNERYKMSREDVRQLPSFQSWNSARKELKEDFLTRIDKILNEEIEGKIAIATPENIEPKLQKKYQEWLWKAEVKKWGTPKITLVFDTEDVDAKTPCITVDRDAVERASQAFKKLQQEVDYQNYREIKKLFKEKVLQEVKDSHDEGLADAEIIDRIKTAKLTEKAIYWVENKKYLKLEQKVATPEKNQST